ncbi:hypothetical protein P7C71_g437, partial [Lecanoromycetidae sp. Uapishka_2]
MSGPGAAFKQTDQEVIDFYARSASTPIPNVPKFDSRRMVDGQRTITFFKPLPPTSTGKKFELKSKVALGGSDPANIREFQARFAAPVKPGDKLVTEAWRTGEFNEGWEEVRFITRVEGGKVVLSNGRALMRCQGEKSRL